MPGTNPISVSPNGGATVPPGPLVSHVAGAVSRNRDTRPTSCNARRGRSRKHDRIAMRSEASRPRRLDRDERQGAWRHPYRTRVMTHIVLFAWPPRALLRTVPVMENSGEGRRAPRSSRLRMCHQRASRIETPASGADFRFIGPGGQPAIDRQVVDTAPRRTEKSQRATRSNQYRAVLCHRSGVHQVRTARGLVVDRIHRRRDLGIGK
jgi:hypothetical protein